MSGVITNINTWLFLVIIKAITVSKKKKDAIVPNGDQEQEEENITHKHTNVRSSIQNMETAKNTHSIYIITLFRLRPLLLSARASLLLIHFHIHK